MTASFVPWRIDLFGGLRATRGTVTITRFRSQKFGTLLAFLALNPHRQHTREELLELLWPDADLDTGRMNLRTALSALRRQFEGEELPAGSFLVTQGYTHVRLEPAAYTTDVSELERSYKAALSPTIPLEQRLSLLEKAAGLYAGPLLPGNYESWLLTERDRLADLFLAILHDLTETYSKMGNDAQALASARRAVSADPLREESHAHVLRLLMRTGETAAARRHYEDFARRLEEDLGLRPSSALKELLSLPAAARKPSPVITLESSVPPVNVDPAPTTVVPPQSLPQPLTRFFGREDETIFLCHALHSHQARLITITGPGGSGKTRLSLEVAHVVSPHFPGGVWFLSLADVREAEQLIGAVAVGLGLPPLTDPTDQIASFFGGRNGPCLLVLDNLEQIVEPGARLVESLLSRIKHLSCLMTSRIRLGCDCEQEFSLAPLPLPPEVDAPDQLLKYPSVALFVNRIQAVRPDFQMNARNAEAVTEACVRLDGIPLALELAAAWAQTLTPGQIVERLSSRFDLLVSRRRGVPERHATLRAAIDWSFQLLAPEQQRFFARLSVFRGGWTLHAAEQVCQAPTAVTMLAELQERSLVVAFEAQEEMRFRMLETLREFAREQLTPDDREELARQHTEYYLNLARGNCHDLWGPDQISALDRLEAEHDNFRAALAWSLSSSGSAFLGMELCRNLYSFWDVRGYASEGRRYLRAAVSLIDETIPRDVRAGVLYSAASFALFQGDLPEAETLLTDSLEIVRVTGDSEAIVNTTCRLGILQYQKRNYAAASQLFREGLIRAREERYEGSEAHLLKCLAAVLRDSGDLDQAGHLLDQAMTLYRKTNANNGMSMILGEMAILAIIQENYDRAETLLQQQMKIAEQIGSFPQKSYCLELQGQVAVYKKDWPRAALLCEQSLHLRRQTGEQGGIAYLTFLLAFVAFHQEDTPTFSRYLSECLQLWHSLTDPGGIALGLCSAAAFASRQGCYQESACLFGAAEGIWPTLTTDPRHLRIYHFSAFREATAAAMPGNDFDICFKSGLRFPADEAVRLALTVISQ